MTQEESADRFTLNAPGAVALGAPPAAPTELSLNSSSISFWLDEVGNNLKATVKFSDGTIKTAIIPLL